MATEAALVARLEARMDKYEKAMKGAEETADKTINNIERQFASTTIGTTLGNVLAKALTGAIEGAIKVVNELIERFQKLQETAEVTGVSMRDAFAVEKLLGAGGLAGFERIATLLDRMQRGEDNFLSKVFDANGVKNIKDASAALDAVVDIIQRAPNLIQAREIGAGLGINNETVDRIRDAANEFGKLRQAAAAAAPDLDKIAEKAREFEAMWKGALDAVKAYLVDKFHEMATPVAEFLSTTLGELRVLLHGIGLVGDLLKIDTSGIRSADNELKSATKTLQDFINKSKEAGVAPERGAASKPPPLGGKGGGGGGSTRLDAFEREERRATERTAQLELEATLVGKTTAERTKALETLRLEQMAIRENLTLDDARRATIDKIAEGYAKSTSNLEAARRAQDRMMFFGNTLVDALDRATTAGAKLKDIISDIGAVMKRALIQGLITGQGPFGGGTGTGLMSLLPKFASGGVVPGSGPVPIMAHGGEVVVPKAVAQRGGLGSVMISQTIDARGAQAGVAEQIAAALSANNRALSMNLPTMIRSAQSRGAIR